MVELSHASGQEDRADDETSKDPLWSAAVQQAAAAKERARVDVNRRQEALSILTRLIGPSPRTDPMEPHDCSPIQS